MPTTVTTNDLTAGKLKYTPPANANGTSFKFKVNDGTVDSNAEYTMTITVTGMNAPASGAPTIDGTAQVGQTLTADTNLITDANGLPGTFAYQWIRAGRQRNVEPDEHRPGFEHVHAERE